MLVINSGGRGSTGGVFGMRGSAVNARGGHLSETRVSEYISCHVT